VRIHKKRVAAKITRIAGVRVHRNKRRKKGNTLIFDKMLALTRRRATLNTIGDPNIAKEAVEASEMCGCASTLRWSYRKK
jgi:hypothetical protein